MSPQNTECTPAQPISCSHTLRHSSRQIDFRRMFLRHSALHAGATRQHAATISRERCIVLMTDDDRLPHSCKPLSEAEFCLTLGLPPRDCGSWQRNQIAWRWQNQTTKESESSPSNIPHQQQHTSSTPTRTGAVCRGQRSRAAGVSDCRKRPSSHLATTVHQPEVQGTPPSDMCQK